MTFDDKLETFASYPENAEPCRVATFPVIISRIAKIFSDENEEEKNDVIKSEIHNECFV